MSSMFKKKGGSAFKPKIPSARARAAPPTLNKPPEAVRSPSTPPPETAAKETPENSSQVGVVTENPLERAEREDEAPPTPQTTKESAPPEPTDSAAPSLNSTSKGIAPSRRRPSINEPVTQTNGLVVQNQATTDEAPHSVSTPPRLPDDPSVEPQSEPPNTRTEAAPIEENVATLPDAELPPSITSPAVTDGVPEETSVPTVESAITAPTPPPSQGPEKEKRAPRKTKTKNNGDETSTRQPRKRKAQTGETREPKVRKRRARSVTPQDAENQVVDLQNLTMSDLTRDLHIGKKFSRHDELRERERQRRLKVKTDKEGDLGGGGVGVGEDGGEEEEEGSGGNRPTPNGDSAAQNNTEPPKAAPNNVSQSGPQFRIVDGQIVIDQSSLVMDRHARAAAAQAGEDMETIEENDFTRLITSNSFMNTSKLRGPNLWAAEETELFYRGLSMFGTDFEMISKMFPGKQRRHVKLKFNREERHNPRRIDAALIGEKTTKMDIDEYRSMTGATFETVEKIEAEQKKMEDEFEAQRQQVADEQAEMLRKKKEELFADDDDGNGNGSGTAARRQVGRGRKNKQKISYGLNGLPVSAEGGD